MSKRKPKREIQFLSVDELIPDPNNARTHSAEQIEQIAASIRRFGFTNPILADEMIRAGHGRLAAARLIYDAGEAIYSQPGKDNGGEELPDRTIPAIDCSGWSDAERRAYMLADNKLAANAGWDVDMLAAELEALMGMDFDMPVVGFDEQELFALFLEKQEGETDANEE